MFDGLLYINIPEYQMSDTGVNIPSVFHISLILSPVTVYRL